MAETTIIDLDVRELSLQEQRDGLSSFEKSAICDSISIDFLE